MKLFFGLQLQSFTFSDRRPDQLFDRVVELSRAAESAGFAALTTMDHMHQIPDVGSQDEAMLEGYTTLAAIAAQTSRVQLGTIVSQVIFRNPAMLAKIVTTLDVISKGRAILGIGAGASTGQAEAYGFGAPPMGERIDRLDEALTICRLMFTEDRPSFDGRYYQIHNALNSPRPIQPGGPRILVGGGGEKRTLGLVARHAHMSHFFGTLADMKRKQEILDRNCEAEKRDPATVMRLTSSPVLLADSNKEAERLLERVPEYRRAFLTTGTPEQVADHMNTYIQAGFTGFTFTNAWMPSEHEIGLGGALLRLLN